MEKFETECLVVGAGPTGLAAAVELWRSGMSSRLIDKSGHAARWSQALVVQARTLEQFERYGIADAAVGQGIKLRRAHVISDGRTVVDFELKGIPGRYPYVLFLPQSETEKLLTDLLQELGGSVERGTELLSIEDRDDRVITQLRLKDGTEQRVESRWLVGCDGAHSLVRERLGIPFEGRSVDLFFFLGDLHLEGPDLPHNELRLYLRHGDVLVVAKLSEDVYRVIVALHAGQSAAANDKKLVVSDFQDALSRAGAQMKVTGSVWMTPFRVNDRQAARYRNKSAFLAGDASHIHSPVGGQGMNTGLQDAANLIWKLKAVRDGAATGLLDSYYEERSAVGKRLLSTTSRGLKAATSGSFITEKLRDAVLSLVGHSQFLQRAAAGFVSETDIDYRHSSIVKELGHSGALRAGDRVPNPDFLLPGGGIGRLLDPLREAKHLVLIAGGGKEARDEQRVREVVSRAIVVTSEDEELAALLGTGTAAIIRPDGYLGFRGAASKLNEMAIYARSVGID